MILTNEQVQFTKFLVKIVLVYTLEKPAAVLKLDKRDFNPRNLAKIDDNNINKKTALVKHVVNFQYDIDFNNCSILAFESDFFKRRFLESFFINNKITTVNDKENFFYNEIYNELK